MSLLINMEFNYDQVAAIAKEGKMEIEKLGNGVIGEAFIVLRSNKKDITISFMLNSASANTNYYKCIYSDV